MDPNTNKVDLMNEIKPSRFLRNSSDPVAICPADDLIYCLITHINVRLMN